METRMQELLRKAAAHLGLRCAIREQTPVHPRGENPVVQGLRHEVGHLDAAVTALAEAVELLASPAVEVPAGGISYDRDVLIEVLVHHYRRDDGSCGCGWNELGKSHPAHVAETYEFESARRDS